MLPSTLIEVGLWGRRVGAVSHNPQEGYLFEYDPEFNACGIEPSPLHLPVRPGVFAFPSLPTETYHGLPALLADALPDEFGRKIIHARLESLLADHHLTQLDYLSQVGSLGMGALEFSPRTPVPEAATKVEVVDMVHASIALLGGVESDVLAAALQVLLPVGISAGGQRAKAIVAYSPQSKQLRIPGQKLDEGFAHWLIKLDGVSPASKNHHAEPGQTAGFGRVEYAYHLMCRAAGIEMSDCALVEEGGRAHFMTRRFDRIGDEKVHVQTLCALNHLDYKLRATHDYDDLFRVIDQMGLGQLTKQEAFRRMVFNVLSFNCDDHTKNFAFTMDRTGKWALSPAYDVTFAYSPNSYWVNQHLMGVCGKFKGIELNDLLAVASKHSIQHSRDIMNQVASTVSKWPEFAQQAQVAPPLTAHIASFILPTPSAKPTLRV